MNSYQVTPEMVGFSGKRLLLGSLLGGGVYAIIYVIGRFVWHSLFSDPLSTVIPTGVIVGFALVFLDAIKFDYKVLVSDDCITVVHTWYRRSIRKDEMKTVTESHGNFLRPGLLGISKYGRFGTWLRGEIVIPKALPEYAAIRDLAMSWKESAKV